MRVGGMGDDSGACVRVVLGRWKRSMKCLRRGQGAGGIWVKRSSLRVRLTLCRLMGHLCWELNSMAWCNALRLLLVNALCSYFLSC